MRRFISLLAAAGLVFCGIAPVHAQEGKKAVFIIAEKDFQDDEFARPLEALRAADVSVTVASTSLQEATGMDGAKARPEMLLKDVVARDYDAIVFIGGSGAAQYLDDPAAHALAKEAVAQKKVLGAICLAPVILANAGLLEGRKATCFPTQSENLKAGSAAYTGKPVERDGLIITADGPGSAAAFGQELVKALAGK